MTSLKTSIKTITYLSDTGCLEIQGASLPSPRLRAKVLLNGLIGTCLLNGIVPEVHLRHILIFVILVVWD
ncbi:hypothetical protein ACN74_10035 [Escherichia coli]|nr:hypothetical protein ACN74_10035 [Escherichia coli]